MRSHVFFYSDSRDFDYTGVSTSGSESLLGKQFTELVLYYTGCLLPNDQDPHSFICCMCIYCTEYAHPTQLAKNLKDSMGVFSVKM